MTVWCEIRDVLQKANACEETILEKLEKNDGEIEDDFRELFRLYLRCRGLKLWLSENLYQKYLALFDELLVIGRRMMGCTVNKDFSAQQSEFIDRLKTHMGISKEMIRMAQRREQQAAMTTFYESPRFADKPEMK